MALTLDEVAETVRNRLGWAPASVPRVKTLVPRGLEVLALRVARRADYETLRDEVNINVVNGVVSLAALTDLLLQVLPETGLLIINGSVAKAAPNYQALTEKTPNDVYRWALRDGAIHVKNINTGALGAVNQAGTLAYSRLPTLANLPDVYNEELTKEVMLLADGKAERSPAPAFNQEEGGLSVNLNAQ